MDEIDSWKDLKPEYSISEWISFIWSRYESYMFKVNANVPVIEIDKRISNAWSAIVSTKVYSSSPITRESILEILRRYEKEE